MYLKNELPNRYLFMLVISGHGMRWNKSNGVEIVEHHKTTCMEWHEISGTITNKFLGECILYS